MKGKRARRKRLQLGLQTCFQPFLERKEKTDNREVFFLEEAVVPLYVVVEKEELFGDGVLVEDDEIADIEKIPIPVKIADAGGDFHKEEKFSVHTAVVL